MSDQPRWDQNLEQQIPGLREAVANLNNVVSSARFRVATIVVTNREQPLDSTIPPTRITFASSTEQPPTMATVAEPALRGPRAPPTAQRWRTGDDFPLSRPSGQEPPAEQPYGSIRSKRASTSMLEGESGISAQYGKRKRFSDPSAAGALGPSGAFWGTVLQESSGSSQPISPEQRGQPRPSLIGPSRMHSALTEEQRQRVTEIAAVPDHTDDGRVQRFSTFPSLRLRSPIGQRGRQPVLPSLQDPILGVTQEAQRDRYASPPPPQARQPDRRFLHRTASQLLGRLSPFGHHRRTTPVPVSPPPVNVEGQLYRSQSMGLPSLFGTPQRTTPGIFSQPAPGDTMHSGLYQPLRGSPSQGIQGGLYGPSLTQRSGSRSASGSGVSHAHPSRIATSPLAEGVRIPSVGSPLGRRGRRGGLGGDREQFFECDLCDSKFRRKSDKNRHVRVVHEKSRPFMCPVCEKTFGEKSNMLKHKASVHDDVRTFRCPYCDASFSQRGLCDNHVRTVHDKKQAKYFCEHCGLPFSRKVQLNDHYEQAHPEFAPTHRRYYVGSSSNAPPMPSMTAGDREVGRDDRSLVGDTVHPGPQRDTAIGVFPTYVGHSPAEGRTTPPSVSQAAYQSPQAPARRMYEPPEEGARSRSFQGDSSG